MQMPTKAMGLAPLPQAGLRQILSIYARQTTQPGGVHQKEQLKAWVEYALEREAVLLFDAKAYEAFIEDVMLPRSIYEIEGRALCH